MRNERRNQRGIALLLAMLASVVILGAITVVVHRVHTSKRMTDEAVVQVRLDEACRAGVDFAIERVWNQYLTGNGNTTGNLASYRVFIHDLVPNSEDVNMNGVQDDDEYDMNGDGAFEIRDPLVLVDEQTPQTLSNGAEVFQLSMVRTDDLTGTVVTIRSTGRVANRTRSVSQTVRIGGEPFDGFEYGILANNINCILCHAEFLSLDMNLSGDPDDYGTFDRIKVASLESLLVRKDEAYSHVAGSMYTRGRVYNQDGSPLSASEIASSKFKGYDFSSDDGKLAQDSFGGMAETGLQNAGADGNGMLEQFANLYMDYPQDTDQMTDGNLPASFPAPYPDENGNRNVDADEFEKVMNSTNGYLTFELDPSEVGGSITGGVAYGVPEGGALSGDSLPTASNSALTSLASDGYYDGNLVLVGTEHDPIVINERVAVDGDLILKGPVKGWGQLLVRRNVYVIGDVTYDDAPGEFGMASDGTVNGLAVTAGGSIMMGDYLTIRAKNNTGDNGKWQGKFIETRTEHKTVTTKDGSSTDVGYFDDGVTDAGWAEGSEGMFSFTTSETTLFNKMEYDKAQADSSYTPRYYRIRPSQPIYQYVGSDEHTVNYFDPSIEVISDITGAVIHDLSPESFWVSEDQLRQFWFADEMSRTSKSPFKFDGLLYSNNCIFCITRSNGRHKSNTYGQMEVRGSVVTADLGMLIPGKDFSNPRDALTLFYDKRVSDFFRVEDTTRVAFRRMVYQQQRTEG